MTKQEQQLFCWFPIFTNRYITLAATGLFNKVYESGTTESACPCKSGVGTLVIYSVLVGHSLVTINASDRFLQDDLQLVNEANLHVKFTKFHLCKILTLESWV